MSRDSVSEIVTYWLIPAEPSRSHLATVIGDLATRFDAPIFEPHVTVYVTEDRNENPDAVLKRALKDVRTFRLSVRGLSYSEKFTKTLFVQFDPHPGLAHFSEELRRASLRQSDYDLKPHLSLLYKKMDPAMKSELASEISLPFREIAFESVKAVISPAKIESSSDVKSWRIVATQPLTG